MISVIIPCYNAWSTLTKLLESIYNSSFSDLEVIVVDDCSTVKDLGLVKKYPIHFLRLKKRSGPAIARNRGAAMASGEILFFLDADVMVERETLSYIDRRYREDPSLPCLVGIYASEPANPSFFANYKALLTTCWFQGLSEYNSFETACGSIRKSVFQELGGFDESFKGADVEDYEFGYRLRQKYKLSMDTHLQVRHHFPTFGTNARNFFKRSFLWTKLYFKKKEFDQAGSSLKEILCRSSVLLFVFAPVGLFFSIQIFLGIIMMAWVFYIGLNIHFFYFCFKEKGFLFFLYSVGVDMINSVIIFAGAFLALITFGANHQRIKR